MKRFYKYIKYMLLMVIAISLLSGCDKKKETGATQQKIITARLKTPILPLYYNAVIEPISTMSVLSPVSGTVTHVYFQYGRDIKNGDKLVTLDSAELSQEFSKAVHDYLNRKNTYINTVESYQGTLMLYKAGVTDKDTFLNEKSTFDNNVLDYYQSLYDLRKVLRKAKVDPSSILGLSISDTSKVNELLHRKFSHIDVDSTGTGIALFPIKKQGQNNQDDKVRVGSTIKEGESVLTIGNMTGLSLSFSVSEININRIKVGMPATVTGDAFPGIVLRGEVSSVSYQAQQSQSGGSGVSMFAVKVKIPNITKEQADTIHVGMTAKIQINIKKKPRIVLPIAAVHQNKQGQSVVTIVEKDGKQKIVPVITGATTFSDVTIIAGVQDGDKVVVHGGNTSN